MQRRDEGRDGEPEWIAEEAKKLSDVVARRAAEKKEDDAERKKEIERRQAARRAELRHRPGYTVESARAAQGGGCAGRDACVVSLSTADGKANWLKHGLTLQRTEAEQKTAEQKTA